MAINEKYIGGTFEDFLKEEGIYEEVNRRIAKKLVAFQLEDERKKRRMSKARMAKTMRTSRSALDRVLDPRYSAISLSTLERAAQAVGCNLYVSIKPAAEMAQGAL